jgi:acetyl esterase
MAKIHHRLARNYLNRVAKTPLDDIAKARQSFEKMSNSVYQPKIRQVQDHKIDGKLSIRHYSNYPSETSIPRPVIIYFHGGGWMLGSINSHDSVCREICRAADIDIISVDYRLSPENTFPAPIEDGLTVISWLKSHADQLNIDPNRLFIGGDSAGGQITAHLAAKVTAEHVRGIILIYPALDPSLSTDSMSKYAKGYFLTKAMTEYFWSVYLPKNTRPWPLPIEQLRHMPPTLHIASENDVLVDEGLAFVQQLQYLGTEAKSIGYPDMLHGFLQFPSIVSDKNKAFRDIAEFIKAHRT